MLGNTVVWLHEEWLFRIKSRRIICTRGLSRHNCGKSSKISNTFLFQFSDKMLVVKAEIHKMPVRKANREDPDQITSTESESKSEYDQATITHCRPTQGTVRKRQRTITAL